VLNKEKLKEGERRVSSKRSLLIDRATRREQRGRGEKKSPREERAIAMPVREGIFTKTLKGKRAFQR